MEVFPEITDTLYNLSNYPIEMTENDEKMVEKFIALLYDRSFQSFPVDSTRKKLFCQKYSAFKNLPPTSAALKYHIKIAVIQVCIVRGQSLTNIPLFQAPERLGNKKKSLIFLDSFECNI